MVNQEMGKRLIDFVILGIIFLFGLSVYWPFSHNSSVQQLVVIFTGMGYFLWGIFYHWHEGDLCFKIILEYLFLAIFATVAVIFLILRQ